jgi:hypothetical protein
MSAEAGMGTLKLAATVHALGLPVQVCTQQLTLAISL